MAISVGDIIRISPRIQIATGDIYVNVHFGRVGSVGGSASEQELMDEFETFLLTAYNEVGGHMPSDQLGTVIKGKNVTQNVLLPDGDFTGFAGTDINLERVNQGAPFVWWPTTVPRVQKRTYLWPFSESNITGNGTILAATRANMGLFAAWFSAGLAQNGWLVEFGAYNQVLGRFTEVSPFTVGVTLRTQRRRRVGVGG